MLRVGSIVIRVDDLEGQTAFWSAVLDYEPRRGDDDEVAVRAERDAEGEVKVERDRGSRLGGRRQGVG